MKLEYKILDENVYQVNYYLYLYKRLFDGFYQKAGFCVLPKPEISDPGIVIFPKKDINLNTNEIKLSLQNLNNRGLILSEKVMYDNLDLQFEIPNYKKLDLFLKKSAPKLLKSSEGYINLMPNNPKIKKIVFEVIPTYMGTAGTSSHLIKDGTLTLRVTYRSDLNTNYLIESYVQALLIALQDLEFSNAEKSIFKWQKREAIIHFFLHNTKFSSLLNSKYDYKDTLVSIDDLKKWGKIINESNKYLTSLGLDAVAKIEINERMLRINDMDIYLTENQSKIMKALILNRGEIVDFDTIGDAIWKDDLDKFSMQALAKEISRIRQKIYDCGFSNNLIFTARKKGVLLK